MSDVYCPLEQLHSQIFMSLNTNISQVESLSLIEDIDCVWIFIVFANDIYFHWGEHILTRKSNRSGKAIRMQVPKIHKFLKCNF